MDSSTDVSRAGNKFETVKGRSSAEKNELLLRNVEYGLHGLEESSDQMQLAGRDEQVPLHAIGAAAVEILLFVTVTVLG